MLDARNLSMLSIRRHKQKSSWAFFFRDLGDNREALGA